MKNENSSKLLRTHAEKIIRKKAEISAWDTDGMTLEQIEQTLYELRVHQVELELQNEELRRVQAELEASKAHYFDFYNLAPVGYCTISETGFLLEANLVIARWLGLTRSKLTRTTFDRYILRTDVDIFYSLQKRLFATNEPQECELRLVKPDKTALWVNLTASNHLGPDGTSECRLVVSDISERKQTEEKYSTLFNNSYDAVFIAEPVSRRLVDCNKAAEMLTGYSRSELLSMQADALHPRDRLAETMTGFQKQVEGISKLVESEIVTKANIRIAVEIAASAITTKNGNYLVGVFRNISERLNFERELAVSDS